MGNPLNGVPQNPNPWPTILWFRFAGEGLPVTLPALPKSRHFRWRRLCGIQIGRWFFGAIEGGPGTPWPTSQPTPSRQESKGGERDGQS